MLKQDILRTSNLIEGNVFKKIIGCYRSVGVHAVITYRFGRWLKTKGVFIRLFLEPLYLYFNYRLKVKWGIELPRAATIGSGLFIGHFGGVVISGTCVIGNNVDISQQVTIGVAGQGDKRGVPIIGNNVYIAPGAKIFGKIRIGNNVKIGANAVVHKSIPDNSVVVMSPGFEILKKPNK